MTEMEKFLIALSNKVVEIEKERFDEKIANNEAFNKFDEEFAKLAKNF